jgi:hypothetical protein
MNAICLMCGAFQSAMIFCLHKNIGFYNCRWRQYVNKFVTSCMILVTVEFCLVHNTVDKQSYGIC